MQTTTYTLVELNTALPDSLFTFASDESAALVEEFESGPIELAGKPAPSLNLKTLDGRNFDLASLRGKPVLIDFWATWCMPCRESMPMLAKLYTEFKDKGLEIVSVSKDDDPADAARYLKKVQYPWVHVADPKWESDVSWGSSGIPRLVLVDRTGKVVFETAGYDNVEAMKLRDALSKMNLAPLSRERSD